MLKRTLSAFAWGPIAFATLATCHSRSPIYDGYYEVDPYCRENPDDCYGDIGGDCELEEDCFDGVCCRDKNCGGGMCTYECNAHGDCPSGMRCEHGVCFFQCDDDDDCGPGQECEHGDSICEYDH